MKKVAVLLMFVVGSLFMSAQVEGTEDCTYLGRPDIVCELEQTGWGIGFVGGSFYVYPTYSEVCREVYPCN